MLKMKGLTTLTSFHRAFFLMWPAPMQIYWNKRIGLVHEHGHHFIVLEHQYDVKMLQVYSTNYYYHKWHRGVQENCSHSLLQKFHNLFVLKMPYNALCALTGMQVKNVEVKIKTSIHQ